jgi:hypothetical protein
MRPVLKAIRAPMWKRALTKKSHRVYADYPLVNTDERSLGHSKTTIPSIQIFAVPYRPCIRTNKRHVLQKTTCKPYRSLIMVVARHPIQEKGKKLAALSASQISMVPKARSKIIASMHFVLEQCINAF